MITDHQTNTVYLADTLAKWHQQFFQYFTKLLLENGVAVETLSNTAGIWAVDYMPIQIAENEFVAFKYDPDYMRFKKYEGKHTDGKAICDELGIPCSTSEIILDGGNVIRNSTTVIMCDKVFTENPNYTNDELKAELKKLFKVDRLIFFPRQIGDPIGHADGMVRFINDNTLLINAYNKEHENGVFLHQFYMTLLNSDFKYEILPYEIENNKGSSANGIYINYLETHNLIVMPIFGLESDKPAEEKLKELFPDKKVVTVKSNEIAKGGGVLNCITWNIKAPKK